VINTLKYAWAILNNKQKIYLFFLFFSIFLVVIFDILSLSILIPFIHLVINIDILKNYPLLYKILEFISSIFNINIILTIIIIFFIFFILRSFLYSLIIFYSNKFSYLTRAEISQKILNYYILLDYEKFFRLNSSEIITFIKQEVPQFGTALLALINLSTNFIIATSIIIFLVFHYYYQLLLLLLIIVISSIIYFLSINRIVKNLSARRFSSEKNFLKNLQEILSSYKEIRIYGREKFFLNICRKYNLDICEVSYKWAFIQALPKLWIEIVFFLILLSIVLFSYLEGGNANESLVPLGVIAFGALRVLPILTIINTSYQNINFSEASSERIYSILNFNDEVKKTENINNLVFENEIKIINLCFNYPDKQGLLLNNINFAIKKGDIIGIKGQSGSGKTTLIEILIGLIKNYRGDIFVDGKNIRENNESWRKNFAYIPQNIFLLDDTIKNNIVFGKDNVDLIKLKKIIKKVELNDLINTLPQGIDTSVGENAAFLSGGQIQRIAIARALYSEKKILIMDESTNALDKMAEKEIFNFIKNNLQDLTVIIISHQSESLNICNKVMDI
jgi:ABC-type multidrug transport system fused ATPase/permease subunit